MTDGSTTGRDRPLVVVAAGGTGGHLFPAEALALALAKRGVNVALATDERATRYGASFPAQETYVIPSATMRGRDPVSLVRTMLALGRGVVRAYTLFGRLRPAAVVGFGGYPTVPPLLAASWRGIPTVIHDANAVIGRANRFLSRRVSAIATTFPDLFANDAALAAKATMTGNPLRAAVIAAAAQPLAEPAPDGALSLLVFGGSQGARIMADIVPPAIERLPDALRARLSVVQQAREEDIARVRETYARAGIKAEVGAFYPDLPTRMAAAHLVIARSGAGTVAELAAIGRPAILIPLPHALDQDQRANAMTLAKAGGALCLIQDQFTPERLAPEILTLAQEPKKLVAMAKAARALGALDAAERLADLVLRVAGVTGIKTA